VELIWNSYYQHKVPHLTTTKGSFWWKDILKLHDQFRENAHCLSGLGDTIGLWEDVISQQPYSILFPNLFAYANNKNLSVKDALATEDLFRLPMSRPAYNEFVLFKEELEPLRNDTYQTDIWVWHWTGGLYTSRMFYKQHFKDVLAPAPFRWIWKAKCMPKIKFLVWLLLVDRLNTRDMLRRRHKHLEEGYHCELCPE
jgi:hypothetical protein